MMPAAALYLTAYDATLSHATVPSEGKLKVLVMYIPCNSSHTCQLNNTCNKTTCPRAFSSLPPTALNLHWTVIAS
jgi:hypothetical protein